MFRFLRTELSSSQLDLLSSRSEVVGFVFLNLYLCLSVFVKQHVGCELNILLNMVVPLFMPLLGYAAV